MYIKNIDTKKITFIALFISIIDIVLLALVENWYKPTYLQEFFTVVKLKPTYSLFFRESFIHVLFIFIVIALFYYSAKVDKKIWFTKYVLSSALILLLMLYNLGALDVIFSGLHYAPYSVVIIISMLYIVPIFGALIIISLIERYLKRK